MFTNKDLSEKSRIPLTKIRLWTKEFLPPDPKATRRSGYTRKISLNEAFYVYLGGFMVSQFGWTFHQARTVLGKIWPWIKKNGIVPEIPDYAKREGIDAEIDRGVKLELHFSDRNYNDFIGFEVINNLVLDFGYKKDSIGREYLRKKVIEISYWALKPDDNFNLPENTFKMGKVTLHLGVLHYWFYWFVEDEDLSLYESWYRKFYEIADSEEAKNRFRMVEQINKKTGADLVHCDQVLWNYCHGDVNKAIDYLKKEKKIKVKNT